MIRRKLAFVVLFVLGCAFTTGVAQADPPPANGCNTAIDNPPSTSATQGTCTFVAFGTTAELAATSSNWTITGTDGFSRSGTLPDVEVVQGLTKGVVYTLTAKDAATGGAVAMTVISDH